MATQVAFRNQSTGEMKSVKVGWSWTLFLFGSVLGIPFFMRKFWSAGVAMIAWDILCVVIANSASDTLLRGAGIGLGMALGIYGNKETARYYLKHGWELAEPDADATICAKEKWALA